MTNNFVSRAGRNLALRMVFLFLCGLWLGPAVSLAEPPAPAPRIVAIGDVHCDFDNLAAILQHSGLIDSGMRWTARNATLVQTGDVLDRGKKCRTVMDLLMSLEKQAPKKGSRVIAMLGNHEMMNITGDLRYAEAMFASFADKQSPARQKRAWEQYIEWQKSRAEALKKPAPVITPEMEAAWLEAHPLGFVEQRAALGPGGKYGRWLRERPAIVQLGSTLFVHGGISPELASLKPEAIAARVRDEIRAWDSLTQFLVEQKVILPFFTQDEVTLAVQEELTFRQALLAEKQAEAAQSGKAYLPGDSEKKFVQILEQFLGYRLWFSIHRDGPLWFRGYPEWTEEQGTPLVSKILESYGASQIVVGHSPYKDFRIHTRFANRVFLIDTGMLSSFYNGGRSAALEITAGKITAVYMDQSVVLANPATQTAPAAPSAKEETPGEVPGGGVSEVQPPQSLPPAQPAAPKPSASVAEKHAFVWKGQDGNPLPFKSDEEVLDFLRTAQIGKSKTVGTGINQIRRVDLEKNGIVVRAAFRDTDEEKDMAKMANGQMELGFRDSFLFEPAAYELSEMLGLHRVPPAVLRKIGGRSGSLQIWVENTFMEIDRLQKKIRPPDALRWNHQIQILRAFDALIYNTDRNAGNILIDPDWNAWFIDHTRAFRRHVDLWNPNAIIECERNLFERLKTFDEVEARQRLKPYLRGPEIDALLKRRVKLIELIQKLIQEKGEDKALYTLE